MKASKAKEIAKYYDISDILKEIKKHAKYGNFSCTIKDLKIEEIKKLQKLGYLVTELDAGHCYQHTFYEIDWL